MTRSCITIGMFGCGTVGTGVYNILVDRADLFQKKFGLSFKIVKICVRHVEYPRHDLKLQAHTSFTQNPNDIISDPSVQCVLELMGGVALAKDVVYQCIRAGKHVVTANKALVASNMDDIVQLLSENSQVQFGCEAAVCGGIPIINTVQEAFIGDEIVEIAGILNGTTNYMLSKMEKTKAEYADVLKEAQNLGYAEADPTADVDGYDAQAKIAILCKLAFGVTVPLKNVPTFGIRTIKSIDFEYASLLNSSIKLLGIAKASESSANGENGEKKENESGKKKEITVYVSPMIVSNDSIMASTCGARNMVHIASKNCIETALLGEGAGRYPTANSVVADLLQIGRYRTKNNASNPLFMSVSSSSYNIENDYTGRFYIRITVKDSIGIIAKMGSIAADNHISIYSILQVPIVDYTKVDFVVTTENTCLSNARSMCQAIQKEEYVLEEPLCLPIFQS